MTIVLLKRSDGGVCYWCGVEGWIRTCNRCGFETCDACWKPHNADSYKFGQERFVGVWREELEQMTSPNDQPPPTPVPVAEEPQCACGHDYESHVLGLAPVEAPFEYCIRCPEDSKTSIHPFFPAPPEAVAGAINLRCSCGHLESEHEGQTRPPRQEWVECLICTCEMFSVWHATAPPEAVAGEDETAAPGEHTAPTTVRIVSAAEWRARAEEAEARVIEWAEQAAAEAGYAALMEAKVSRLEVACAEVERLLHEQAKPVRVYSRDADSFPTAWIVDAETYDHIVEAAGIVRALAPVSGEPE